MKVILSSIGLYMFLAIISYNLVYATPDYSVCNAECKDCYRADYYNCIQICKLRADLRDLLEKK